MHLPVLELDKPRRLKFGVVAARAFKKQFGESLVSSLRKGIGGAADGGEVLLDLDWATNLLWAALVHEDGKLTVDRAAGLLEVYLTGGGTLKDLYEKLGDAFNESARTWGFIVEEEAPEGKDQATTPAS